MASPPALAPSTCPKLLAIARDDDVGGDAKSAVGEVARGQFGSRALSLMVLRLFPLMVSLAP